MPKTAGRSAVVTALIAALALQVPAAWAAPEPEPTSAPRTASQAMEQLTHFNEQFEKVTERYNDARILLRKRQGEARAAERLARVARARLVQHEQEVGRIVSSSYRTAPFGQFAAMLSSGSPEEFAAQARHFSTLSAVDAATPSWLPPRPAPPHPRRGTRPGPR
jgi:hypothetical protein